MKIKKTVLVLFVLSGMVVLVYLGVERFGEPVGIAVKVKADKGWTDTGITLKAGECADILAKGSWSHGPEGPNGQITLYGPEGFDKVDPSAILPHARIGSLIAKIGSDGPVVIGKNKQITCFADGKLYVAMNEVPGRQAYDNNQGELTVFVQLSQDAEEL